MDLLDRLLGHDAWTTRRLLELSLPLSDDALDREFDIGHRTLRRTLAHVVRNEEGWTGLMMGERVAPGDAGERPGVAALLERHDRARARLHAFARSVADGDRWDETFVDHLDRPARRKAIGAAILHVATHGMHHRAQALFMLRRLGVSGLPEGDAMGWESWATGGWPEA